MRQFLFGISIILAIVAFVASTELNSSRVHGSALYQSTPTPVNLPILQNVKQISAKVIHTCAVTYSGAAKCWGWNDSGQLGDGTTISRSVAVDVIGLNSGVTAIAAGDSHTCALMDNGTVECWGAEETLGGETSSSSTVPISIPGLQDVAAISAGNGYTCALTHTGSVKCWGNYMPPSPGITPTIISGLESNVAQISAGDYHACVVTTQGSVKCWGSGYLGDGSSDSNSIIPVAVSGLESGVTSVSAGYFHTCAVTYGGAAKCWGQNLYGELGDGTEEDRLTPVDVIDVIGSVSQIVPGRASTCVLTISGGVKCWGLDYGGLYSLLNNYYLDRPGLTSGVVAITGIGQPGCALMSIGAVKCWGYNFPGNGHFYSAYYGDYLNKAEEVLYNGPQICPIPANAAAETDTDGDGLLDVWETCGYDTNGDGKPEVNLLAMGADPKHKDIFIQADYMIFAGLSLQPSAQAIQTVVQAFDKAPVNNPDGKPGIHIHVDFGKNAPLSWGKAATWGDLSRSKSLTGQQYIGTCTGNTKNWQFNWDGFNALKQQNFPAERSSIFHYSIWAYQLCNLSGNSSGQSFSPGKDMIISLGGWINNRGTVNEQAGTFMHELGHNLGFDHGGDDPINRKPNYLSVMNYMFQTKGLIIDGKEGNFDYSRFSQIPSLDENHLDETVGLNAGSLLNTYGTRYYCGSSDKTSSTWVNNANSAIDWDCDTTQTSKDTQANINGDLDSQGTPILSASLNSYDDWTNIVLDKGLMQVSSSSVVTVAHELTKEEDDMIPSPYEVGLSVPYQVKAQKGITTTFNVQVANLGTNQDSYLMEIHSEQGDAIPVHLPITVSISPHETVILPVSITIPQASIQTEHIVVISASSQTNPLMQDSGRVIINISSNPSQPSIYLPLISK